MAKTRIIELPNSHHRGSEPELLRQPHGQPPVGGRALLDYLASFLSKVSQYKCIYVLIVPFREIRPLGSNSMSSIRVRVHYSTQIGPQKICRAARA